MNIIITGSEGFIGKYLRMYLTSQGHDVQGLDLSLGHDLTDENFAKLVKACEVMYQIPDAD